ncbi:lipopolysaccharide biosynthesis protein [Bacteroides intestinalis]|jgi:O-antigen/teichoic acid export membrane protein|uniref:Uncharacterized protein n=1 Tax=Bacteroides intestinalis TaxID=329854 RepID=A0A414LC92_9BACE|nr:polysaccharide biosynthesis C-terminal domain-containing protein [Bacteroides intestinalis]RHE92123.1 hypothetical protein DW712_11215 [Bacteroides intestinalis]
MVTNKYKRLGVNTLFVFIGNIGPRLISFLLMPFYTYWMSKEDFGIQDIIYIYSVLIIPYVSLGLYEAVFVFPKNKKIEDQSKYFSSAIFIVFLMCILFGILLLLLPDEINNILFPDPLKQYVPILFVFVVLESFQRILQSFTRGIDKMKVFSITGTIYAMVMLISSIILIPQFKLKGYWISLLLADFISILYTFIAIKALKYLHIKCMTYLKEMLYFSIPLIPNATMWWIVNSINRPILMENVGIEGVGLYSVAGKFPSILNVVFTIFFSAFQISALEEYSKDNYKIFYNNIFRVIFYIQIILTIGFELFGGLIFECFIDEKFYVAAHYLPILCLGVVISNIAAYIGVTFTVTKKTKYFLYSAICAAITALIGNSLLIPRYGIMGACIAIVISQSAMVYYRWYKSRNVINFTDIRKLNYISILYVSTILCYYCISNTSIKITCILLEFILITLLNSDILRNIKLIKRLK